MEKMLRDMDSTLDLEDLLEEGMETILVFLENTVCLENPMDRGDWWAIVHGGHRELDMTERLSLHMRRSGSE